MRGFVFAFVTLAVGLASASPLERRAVTLPPANGKFDYQLGGAYTPASGTTTVVRDRTASPAAGLYNICYVNGFQTQAVDADWWKTNHHDLILHTTGGSYFEDPNWPGEYLLDTRTAAKRAAIANIIKPWITQCGTDGFNAVELDNLDSFTRSSSRLTQANNLALATLLVSHAHTLNLAVAQKNTAELGSTGKTTSGFDFAIAEECEVWSECHEYTNAYGTAVLEVEYTDVTNALQVWQNACTARGSTFSIIYRDRDLVPSGGSGYHYQEC